MAGHLPNPYANQDHLEAQRQFYQNQRFSAEQRARQARIDAAVNIASLQMQQAALNTMFWLPQSYSINKAASEWLDGQPACQKLPGPCKRGLPMVV